MPPDLTHHFATFSDSAQLAEWNHQLIRDEGHRNPMTVEELDGRMRGWLDGEYRAIIFKIGEESVAYALYQERAEEIHLRQFFVVRPWRRNGIGRLAIGLLREKIWPDSKRLTVEVLTANTAATGFWRSVGFSDYSLTLERIPLPMKPS